MQDKINPITLSEIDDSNEWLLGKLDDSDKDDDNDFVYEGEDLCWSDLARASGVGESEYCFRSRNVSTSKGASSFASAKRKQSLARTSLVDEEEINLDDETKEDTNGYKSSDGDDDYFDISSITFPKTFDLFLVFKKYFVYCAFFRKACALLCALSPKTLKRFFALRAFDNFAQDSTKCLPRFSKQHINRRTKRNKTCRSRIQTENQQIEISKQLYRQQNKL